MPNLSVKPFRKCRGGQSVRSVSRELGVTESQIHKWRRDDLPNGDDQHSGTELTETQALKKRIRELVLHTSHLPEGPAGPGPSVSFARSGITAAWDPKFESLLELAEACDVPVRWSCRSGVSHLCISGLISGSIGYQPEPLESP